MLAKAILQNIQLKDDLDSCNQTRADLQRSITRLNTVVIKQKAATDSVVARDHYLVSSVTRLESDKRQCAESNQTLSERNEELVAENQRRKTGGRIFKTLAGAALLFAILK